MTYSTNKRAGDTWMKDEVEVLKREVAVAISQIAQNHDRSIGAIEARIKQEKILYPY